MTKRFWALFWSTVQREYRSKTMLAVFFITIFVMFAVNAMFDFVIETVSEQAPGMDFSSHKVTVFYYIISSWVGILSVLMGVGCLATDVDSNVLPVVLSFPIPRWLYLSSRILGTTFIVLMYYVLSIILALIIFSFSATGAGITISTFIALVPTFFYVLGTITIAAFIGLHANRIVALLFSFFVLFLITVSNSYLGATSMERMFTDLGPIKILSLLTFWPLPHLGALNGLVSILLGGKEVVSGYVFEGFHFLITYSALAWVLIWSFKKREV